jgi:iron complex outermembrane receptor protein
MESFMSTKIVKSAANSYRTKIKFLFSKNTVSLTLAVIIISPHLIYAAEQPAAQKENWKEKAGTNLSNEDKKSAEQSPTQSTANDKKPAQKLSQVNVRAKKIKTINEKHDEPVSVSVVTGKALERELAQDYNAISKRLANVTFNQSNTRGASLSIRGVGKRAFAETQDPSVLVVQDGVSFGLTSLGNFDFYDIETVESYRGPQGTLGGKGGSSGAVYVTTKRPSFTPSSDFSITYGQRDTLIVKAATGGPIVEDLLAWRGAIVVNKGAGYYRNEYDENYSMYNKNRLSGRVQFLLTPTEDFTARLSVDLEPHAPQLQNGLSFRHDQPLLYEDGSLTDPTGSTARAKLFGIADKTGAIVTPARAWFTGRDYTYYNDYNNEERNSVNFNENQGQTVSNKGASLELNYDLEDNKFTSVTAWREFSFDAHNDEGTPFDISRDGGGGVFYTQYSQEFRINSKPGGIIDYQAGVIAFKTEDDIVSKTGWGSDAGAWFANTTQYNTLERNAGVNRGAGLALLRDSLSDAIKRGDTWVDTQSNAIYGQADWHWTEAATLTAGLRIGTEDRTTEDAILLTKNGSGQALNPVDVRGIQLGGFASIANGNLGATDPITKLLVNNNSAAQLSLADSVANRYYGATITDTPGAAYTSLTAAQKAQVGAAKALRAAQIGQLFNKVTDKYEDTLYTSNISQRYKFNDQVTAYGTWQHGEKPGTGFNINGVPTGVKPEKTDAFELGVKSFLFEDTLTLNADIFVMDIDDYQQAIRVLDEFTTNVNLAAIDPLLTGDALQSAKNAAVAYLSTQGNVNKVKVQGLEFDGAYSGIENFTFRFSGAYNDAHYEDFKNSPKPDELAYLKEQFVDQSGKALPGAAKYTLNLGVEYRHLAFGKTEFHTSFNAAYTSSYLTSDTLSSYSLVPGYTLVDGSIGFSSLDNKFDISLIAKNLFNKLPHEKAWTTYEPYPYPRWLGLSFTSHY